MYTDLTDSKYSIIDLQSVIIGYEYAVSKENKIYEEFLKLFTTKEKEDIHISKRSKIYKFLKTCPRIVEDKITWKMIENAYTIARIQNNNSMLKELGKIISREGTYIKNNNEDEGIILELTNLKDIVKKFILKYNNITLFKEKLKDKKSNLIQFIIPQEEIKNENIQIIKGQTIIEGTESKRGKIITKEFNKSA